MTIPFPPLLNSLPASPSFSDADLVLDLLLLILAPLAIAGVALINVGLGRSRSAAQALLGNMAIIATALIGFALVGATFTGSIGGPGHILHLAGKPWNWLGEGSYFLIGIGNSPIQSQLEILFEFLAVAMAAIIPWGSGADRLRLSAGCAIAAVLSILIFPVLAHWVWAGGWLRPIRNPTSAPAQAFSIRQARERSTFWAVCRLSPSFGLPAPVAESSPKKDSPRPCPATMPSTSSSGVCVALVGWLGSVNSV